MKGSWAKAQGMACRLFHTIRVLRRGITQKGGVRGLALRGFHSCRREGLRGVLRDFAYMRHMLRSPAAVSRNDYGTWIDLYDTVTDEYRLTLTRAVDALQVKPLISVIMPVHNPVPKWLEAAIESVRGQIYPDWELCIADDASTDKTVRQILERYKELDSRINVVFRERNGHISAASNSALTLAKGEWIVLLDHDDLLSEQALFWVAEAINRVSDAGIIYSDEDKISEHGVRKDPYFKCDWNYELFLSQNMISHLGAYRRDLLIAAGSFREGFEGAQDYDLALRCVERLNPSQIVHIPRVLYSWRVHAESTAKTVETKPYALLAGERAMNEHLARQGINGRATLQPRGVLRVQFTLAEPAPMASIIVLAGDEAKVTQRCLRSLVTKTKYDRYEILLVITVTGPETWLDELKTLEHADRICVIRSDRRLDFATAANLAVSQARGEFIVLVESRIEATSTEWLAEMISQATQPGVGAVGARLLYPNGSVHHAGMIVGLHGVAGYSHRGYPAIHTGYFCRAVITQRLSAVTAACLAVRKTLYVEVGGLKEELLSFAFSGVDLCLRLDLAGYKTIYAAYAELYFHEAKAHVKNVTESTSSELDYMKLKWGAFLNSDPTYSPNLTLDYDDFSYAWPPRSASGPVSADALTHSVPDRHVQSFCQD